tara:strand:- start:872 stop:1162 length:291 start_codon:yes stop_codon:yes gene_type:complete
MYMKVAPIVSPTITTRVPIHFPKIKPPIMATGEAKPKRGKTHKIVKIKKIKNMSVELEFFISKKYDLFSLMKSYDIISWRLNLEKKKYKNKQISNK